MFVNNFKNLCLFFHLVVINLLLKKNVECFSNIFGELFNDLKFGTFENEGISQKIISHRVRCPYGSYVFNGSCYYFSDRRSNNQKEISQSIFQKVTNNKLDKPAELFGLSSKRSPEYPSIASWEDANNICNQMEPFSSLIQFSEKESELGYVINLMKNFSHTQSNDLVKYWIGLTFQDFEYKWVNGIALNNSILKEIINNYDRSYSGRCASLNFKKTGDIEIEWEDCQNVKRAFLCRYVYDRCTNNTSCGKNGACVNVPSKQSFECECRIFYDGPRCNKWSNQGIQMIIALILILCAILFLAINRIYSRIKNSEYERLEKQKRLEENYKHYFKSDEENEPEGQPFLNHRYSIEIIEKNIFKLGLKLIRKKLKFFILILLSVTLAIGLILGISITRYKIIKYRIEKYKKSSSDEPEKSIDKDRISKLTNIFSIDICKVMNSEFMEDYVLIFSSLSLTLFIYFWNSFKFFKQDEFCECQNNYDLKRLSQRASKLLNSKNLSLFGYRFFFSFEFPIPMNPFNKRNRFLTCVIYAAYTYNILKIFEHLVSSDNLVNNLRKSLNETVSETVEKVEKGILMGLLKQILVVFTIGLRYYPVLLCIDLKRKSKVCYLLCTLYVLFLLIYYSYMNMFCLLSAYSTIKQAIESISNEQKALALSKQFNLLSELRQEPVTVPNLMVDTEMKQNLTRFIKDELFIRNFMFEKFLFYIILCLIVFYMISEFCILILEAILNRKNDFTCKYCGSDNPQMRQGDKVDNELKYTKNLFKKQKPISFFKNLISKYVYENRRYFRYSKEFINTNMIAFILLYYITCLIIRKSSIIVSISSRLVILVINFIFELGAETEMAYMLPGNRQIKAFISSLHNEISFFIIMACCITTSIYVTQLLLGIRSFHTNVLNGYRGVYENIPSPKKLSNGDIALSSLHYSGYTIGYMLWGYLILFEISLVMILVVKVLIHFYFIAENLAKIILPILTIYLLKRILMWYLCSYLVSDSNSMTQQFVLKNKKFYFILNHFNFFFDCFLGSFVCFVRMAKSSLAALFFMPRLDYSIFGGFLESKDMGFLSYVSFIHMEVNQTHPVKLAFCELMRLTQIEPNTTNKKSKLRRNKWFLLYTLMKNPNLRRLRKGYLFKLSLIPKVETLDQFIKRQKNKIFDDKLKRSRSIDTLGDTLDESIKLKN
ncbi:unnamed protein product [Brachionus calyciflorus]|uniref:EGF-like domain-containing protein n=1 Tax=Brachionus calyciflorus TaxID=104777 RepID=A0A813QAM2_9BILA|nr:unnamed protein product [Brachionus calyciflorus]